MSLDSHVFAFFSPAIDDIFSSAKRHSPSTIVTHKDEPLAHRLQRVVRARTQQEALLFGKKYSFKVILQEIHNAHITFTIVNAEPIKLLAPIINLWLPLIEKPALEQAIYAATALGVHTIYFIPTAKSKRLSLASNELERLSRIMIAAAEQSKQFLLPTLRFVSKWSELPQNEPLILTDLHGSSLTHCVQKLNPQEKSCTLIVGPEGDFTLQEKQQLDSLGVLKAKLVPSVLRSEDAVMVSLGILRSLLST